MGGRRRGRGAGRDDEGEKGRERGEGREEVRESQGEGRGKRGWRQRAGCGERGDGHEATSPAVMGSCAIKHFKSFVRIWEKDWNGLVSSGGGWLLLPWAGRGLWLWRRQRPCSGGHGGAGGIPARVSQTPGPSPAW